ncbi:MAG: PEP-CTERM sorting domain-containing protein [Acidobacteriia bacterium]|nr:PEP-CTERM sorting domain-containing protein [Terriglobia bacterium]
MKQLVFALSLALFFTATAGATVTYSTSGLFNCTNGTFTDAVNSNTDTISGCSGGGSSAISLTDQAGDETITLSFNNLTNSLNASNGTAAFYGTIVSTCAGLGCVSNATSITLGLGVLNVALLISETAPDVAANNDAGTANITGGIAFDSSTMQVGSYSGSPVTVTGLTDTVIYTINAADTLFSPNSGVPGSLGESTLGMTITDENVVNSQTPEPAALGMMGVGLVGLGFARRRKAS